MDIPPECQPLASQLADREAELAGAQTELAEATGSAKAAAGREVQRKRAEVNQARAELEACCGCPDPVTTAPTGTISLATTDPRFRFGSDFLFADPLGDPVRRGLMLEFRGCHPGHEHVVGVAGWSALVSSLVRNITLTVPRRFPDLFTFSPPGIAGPYVITVVPVVSLTALGGRYERSSGHIDLGCELRIGWLPLGGPPRHLEGWLYGLDFGPSLSTFLLTSRSVPTPLFPPGSAAGTPLALPARTLDLVGTGVLGGGFATATPFVVTINGSLGAAPVGP